MMARSVKYFSKETPYGTYAWFQAYAAKHTGSALLLEGNSACLVIIIYRRFGGESIDPFFKGQESKEKATA